MLIRADCEDRRSTTPPLIYHNSRRVFLFGALQAQRAGIAPDRELLSVAALFHDVGLVSSYRSDERRFELDGADVDTDVLALRLDLIGNEDRRPVVTAHPRPDLKRQILAAFDDGFRHRPNSTFGTVNADVLAHVDPDFRRTDFVDVIKSSAWPE